LNAGIISNSYDFCVPRLIVTAQRENILTQTLWYKDSYEEAKLGFTEVNPREKGVSREDRIHGSLLVINELLRISNNQWERTFNELNVEAVASTGRGRETKETFFKIKRSQAANFPKLNQLQTTVSVSCESAACKRLLMEHYNEICKSVLECRGFKNIYVQNTLLLILPRLAAFNVNGFCVQLQG